jgi:hypothetical protein
MRTTSLPIDAVGHAIGHGRILRVGQVWRSNDPRRLKAVRILDIVTELRIAEVENILTGKRSLIALQAFTIGSRGWSLETPAA